MIICRQARSKLWVRIKIRPQPKMFPAIVFPQESMESKMRWMVCRIKEYQECPRVPSSNLKMVIEPNYQRPRIDMFSRIGQYTVQERKCTIKRTKH